MKSKTIAALVIGLSAFSFASNAGAQDATRDAAIHKCIMEAQARFPNVSDDNTQRARTEQYRSCMRAAGQNP